MITPRETPWRMVFRLAGAPRVALILVLMLTTALTEGIGLLLLVPMLQSLDGGGGAGGGALGRLLPLGSQPLAVLLALFVALVVVRALAGGWHQYLSARLTARVIDGLRARALSALLHADWGFLAAMRQAQNRALLITSIDRVWQAVNQGLQSIAIAINLAILASAAIVLSWKVALGMVAVGAVTLLLYGGLRGSAQRLGVRLGAAYRVIYARFEESLGGLRLYKSYGREQQALAARRWLARRGIGSNVHIGVRKDQLCFQAHAWLKVGERIVTGGDVSSYAELPPSRIDRGLFAR